MEPVLDSLGVVLHEIRQKYHTPNYVKEASMKELTPPSESADFFECVADPIRGRYPCHTKAAAWVSSVCFAEHQDELPEDQRTFIGNNLEKYANFWGIVPEVQSMLAERAKHIKQASVQAPVTDDQYAISCDVNGKPVKAGLMRNPEELCKAASWLEANRDSMPLDMCTGIAKRILKRASAMGSSVNNVRFLEQLSGMGVYDAKGITDCLETRAGLVASKNKEASELMHKLASKFKAQPFSPGSPEMYKTACAIDKFDQCCGLTAMRRRGDIPYPEDVCYHVTSSDFHKFASENVRLQTGDIYPLSKVGSLSRMDFESNLGTDLADACYSGMDFNPDSASAVLPTLPRPDAERFREMLASRSISPIAQERADSGVSIPDDYYEG